MVNWLRQVTEELLQGSRVVRVEGGGALSAHLQRRLLEAIRIAPGEDDVGALCPGASSRLQPDPRAAADDHDGLSA